MASTPHIRAEMRLNHKRTERGADAIKQATACNKQTIKTGKAMRNDRQGDKHD